MRIPTQPLTGPSVPERPRDTPSHPLLVQLLLSLRPKQWPKNFLVFLALVFSVKQYWNPADLNVAAELLRDSSLAFVLFCVLSGATYIINDLADAPQDREHPTKRYRPIASGGVPTPLALSTAGVLALLGIAGSFLLETSFGLLAMGYTALMIAYSLSLKHMVILDVFVIATGFLLRAVGGALVINVPISPWLYLCTILGALFIGLVKRRQEIVLLEGEAASHRRILDEYSLGLIDQMINVVTPSTVIAYSFYTFSAESLPANHAMMLTIPFVLYGIFRYLYLSHTKSMGGSPEEVLLKDKPLLIDILLWIVVSATVLIVYRAP